MIEVEPEMHIPLRNLNRTICHKFIAKLDKTLAQKADNDAIINVFFLPYASERKPQECDVKIMPEKLIFMCLFCDKNYIFEITRKPRCWDETVLCFRCDANVTFSNWKNVIYAHGLEKGTAHENACD